MTRTEILALDPVEFRACCDDKDDLFQRLGM
jgi:hypothetical protein